MSSSVVETNHASPLEPAAAPIVHQSRLLIPLIVAVGGFMQTLDSTIVTTAIPQIADSLHVPPVRITVAITSYLISLAVVTPISGWLADRFGTRAMYCWAIALFTIGSALCGMCNSLHMMVLMRILQGCGGGLLTPVGRLILVRSFGKDELLTAMSYMIIPAVIGPTIGPLAGGYLATYANWRWIFYVNIPIGLAGIALSWWFVHDDRSERRERFDFVGFAIVGIGLGLLEFAIDHLGRRALSRWTLLALFVTAAIVLAAYVPWNHWIATRKREIRAVIDFRLFSIRTFRLALLTSTIVRAAGSAAPFLVPLLLELGFGFSAMRAGWMTFTSSLGAIFIKPISQPLIRRFGFRGVLIGNALLLAASIAGLIIVHRTTPDWLLLSYLLVFGLFRSLQFILTVTLAYTDIDGDLMSQATPVERMVQQLATGLGIALAAAGLALAGNGTRITSHDFRLVFLWTAALSLLSIWGFLALRPEETRKLEKPR